MTSHSELVKELGVSVPSGNLSGPPAGTDAAKLSNDPTMEGLWAMKAMEHAELHFNILCVVDPRSLRLTQNDQTIYDAFRNEFGNFNVEKIPEAALKSKDAKEKWRPFMNDMQKEVMDFSFATLLRLDTAGEYNEENTILVTRVQFLCIEVARNREGFNDAIRHNFRTRSRHSKTTIEES